MVERESDRSIKTPKNLTKEEREAWNRLVMRLGLEDVWKSDDFTHYSSLSFSWSNKQKGAGHCKACLDRFYVGDWDRDMGRKPKFWMVEAPCLITFWFFSA